MKPPQIDPYDVLGIKKDASQEDIKTAYKKLIIEHHPDKGGSVEKAQEINAAYEVLGDVEKKKAFDNSQSQMPNSGDPLAAFFRGMPGGFHFQGQAAHIFTQQTISQTIYVKFSQLVKGGEIEVQTQIAKIKFSLPPNTEPGKQFRIRIKKEGNNEVFLNLTVMCIMPKLPPEAIADLEKLGI